MPMMPCSTADVQNDSFVHATYVVGSRLKDCAQLDAIRFDQFDFMYVMAGPDWKAADFDLPAADVMRKLAEGHSYPQGREGLALVPELIARAHRSKVKVLVSLPGTDKFDPVASDSGKRALFARTMAAFVKKHDYDGIEIDWEGAIDRARHALLLADLRQALNAVAKANGPPERQYFLTTALHWYHDYPADQAQQLCASIDWVNIMTYDMGGGIWGNIPSHNTPLNRMKEDLKHWSVFPRNKLCIGLASYGFRYKGILPGQKSETSLKAKGRYCSYTELPPLLENGWTESYDSVAEAPYYFSPDKTEWITIDSTRSLSQKIGWVLEAQYRGVFWWEFQSDYLPPAAGRTYARHPLIDHVTDAIKAFEQNAQGNARKPRH